VRKKLTRDSALNAVRPHSLHALVPGGKIGRLFISKGHAPNAVLRALGKALRTQL
jgi:hypothetical protein